MIFDGVSVEFRENDAGVGEALQDESRAAEKTCAELSGEGDVELHRFFRADEGVLVHEHGLSFVEIEGEYLAREIGGKCDLSVPAPRLEIDDEDARAGDCAPEHSAQSSPGMGVHFDGIGYPGHGARVGIDGSAVIEVDCEDLLDGAEDMVSKSASGLAAFSGHGGDVGNGHLLLPGIFPIVSPKPDKSNVDRSKGKG